MPLANELMTTWNCTQKENGFSCFYPGEGKWAWNGNVPNSANPLTSSAKAWLGTCPTTPGLFTLPRQDQDESKTEAAHVTAPGHHGSALDTGDSDGDGDGDSAIPFTAPPTVCERLASSSPSTAISIGLRNLGASSHHAIITTTTTTPTPTRREAFASSQPLFSSVKTRVAAEGNSADQRVWRASGGSAKLLRDGQAGQGPPFRHAQVCAATQGGGLYGGAG